MNGSRHMSSVSVGATSRLPRTSISISRTRESLRIALGQRSVRKKGIGSIELCLPKVLQLSLQSPFHLPQSRLSFNAPLIAPTRLALSSLFYGSSKTSCEVLCDSNSSTTVDRYYLVTSLEIPQRRIWTPHGTPEWRLIGKLILRMSLNVHYLVSLMESRKTDNLVDMAI